MLGGQIAWFEVEADGRAVLVKLRPAADKQSLPSRRPGNV
jgi:hypothetical protein